MHLSQLRRRVAEEVDVLKSASQQDLFTLQANPILYVARGFEKNLQFYCSCLRKLHSCNMCNDFEVTVISHDDKHSRPECPRCKKAGSFKSNLDFASCFYLYFLGKYQRSETTFFFIVD